MSWQEYQNNDRREQEQLEIIRALIEDATKDTVLRLQDNPLAEERIHFLAIQAGLGDLARIIERRMDRRTSPRDEWDWSETVREVLSRLDKAGEVRGHVVGKGLARLAERLPRELPGPQPRRVSQAPAPATRLRGTGGWTPDQPKPTHRPPSPPAYFPSDLWPQTVVILDEACKRFPDQGKTLELCKYVISEMTPLFCEAVKTGTMRADQVLSDSGMEGLLHSLLVYNCDHGNERFRLAQEERNSDEYRELAKAIVDAEAKRKGMASATGERAQNSAKSAQSVESKSTNSAADNERESFVQPILDEKGWSIHQLAVEAEVDFHTVNDYLKGRTRPNRSTRKHLADALGIAVDRLPK